MTHYNFLTLFNNRLFNLGSLFFFLFVFSIGCSSKQEGFQIVWKGEKAIAIQIPSYILRHLPQDSIHHFLSLKLQQTENKTSILGIFNRKQELEFIPVIPFTSGMQYELYYKSEKIGGFKIPKATASDIPQILSIFPKNDTVPENLLKIYLQFSHPMSEGQTEKYIHLIKNEKDTLTDVFLFLQLKLWNEDRTVLTLWFHPGRIKRHLQPNLKSGAPLVEKENYQLFVSKEWRDNQGRNLEKDFFHSFYVGKRDSVAPNIENWQLHLPKSSSKSALQIKFIAPLDHFSLMECLHITTKEGNRINGSFTATELDKEVHFIPNDPWKEMEYVIEIESRLEDLAGNNLNRVFDRDITQPKKGITNNSTKIPFRIK